MRPAAAVTVCAIIQLTTMCVFLGSGSIPAREGNVSHALATRTQTRARAHTHARTFSRVETAEVGGSVDDNTLDRYVEPEVQTLDAIGFENLGDAVSQPGELSLCQTLADVGGESRSGEVKRINEAERSRAGGAAGRQVAGEVAPELLLLIHSTEEDLLVLVFEGEVEGLGWKVSDHVGQVASPEGNKALFLWDPNHTVDDPFVLHLRGDLFAGMLDLRTEAVADYINTSTS